MKNNDNNSIYLGYWFLLFSPNFVILCLHVFTVLLKDRMTLIGKVWSNSCLFTAGSTTDLLILNSSVLLTTEESYLRLSNSLYYCYLSNLFYKIVIFRLWIICITNIFIGIILMIFFRLKWLIYCVQNLFFSVHQRMSFRYFFENDCFWDWLCIRIEKAAVSFFFARNKFLIWCNKW